MKQLGIEEVAVESRGGLGSEHEMMWKKSKTVESAPPLDEHRASCSALCCASRGDCVLVRFLLGSASETARLREMGLCEGARVQVLRHGSPIVVRVADSRLGLAHAIAERVLVVPDEAVSA